MSVVREFADTRLEVSAMNARLQETLEALRARRKQQLPPKRTRRLPAREALRRYGIPPWVTPWTTVLAGGSEN